MGKNWGWRWILTLGLLMGLLGGLFPAAPVRAACSGLFFSEYVEGSGYNKALEIYNGTGSAVNLSGYKVKMYFNGSSSATLTINLVGTVASGDVFVVTPENASAELLALADQTYGTSWFNGDDALVLENGSGGVVDVIGQIGTDPGSEWGSGLTSTADNTLRRKVDVSQGDANGGDAFTPAAEWDGYATDTFDGLGSHSATCSGGGPTDVPPTVASTSPSSGATGVATAANITVNFSEPVTVTTGWYTLTCTISGEHTAAQSGGPSSYTLDPDTSFNSSESCTVEVYADHITDQDGDPHAMQADYVWSFSTGSPPSPCSTIPLIQGSGNSSPCVNQTVSNITGCITGIAADGFYMQDESGDGNPATSDGIYVYRGSTWTNPSNWEAGDRVRVGGKIIEYYNTTEFQYGSSVSVLGTCAVPTPVTIQPNTDPAADPMTLYERYEGMRVQMSFAGWVVGPTKRFDSRFAVRDPELALVDFGSSIPDYARVLESDYPGYRGLTYLSGGLNVDLPDLDFGDRVSGSNLTGVLGYQFDKYTLLVDTAPSLTTTDRPDVTSATAPADPDKREFDVCFFNVENLFDRVDDGMGDYGDWIPTSDAAYQAKLAGLAEEMTGAGQNCAVWGVSEVEGKQAVYNALASALHTTDSTYTWTVGFVLSGDSRNITQGFLWRNDVTLVGSVTPVSGSPFTGWVTDGTLDFVRTPPTAKFRFLSSSPMDVQVYALHLKSKRASTSCSTPDCTDKRLLEAADLRDILAHHQDAGEYAIAGGDFNDYLESGPINILNASPKLHNPYFDLPTSARYSYIFSGESETLDYLVMTANLTATAGQRQYTFSPIHVNADFPSAEHVSDHDPVRVVFSSSDQGDLAASYGDAWHFGPHARTLGATVDNDGAPTPESDNASDDGVTRGAEKWQSGATITLTVQVAGGSGWLAGWIDWNDNGVFTDTGEAVVDRAVSSGATQIPLTVPAAVSGSLAARFRLYESATDPGAAPTGGVTGGEVEDYLWSFGTNVVTLRGLRCAAGGGLLAGLLLMGTFTLFYRRDRRER